MFVIIIFVRKIKDIRYFPERAEKSLLGNYKIENRDYALKTTNKRKNLLSRITENSWSASTNE